MPAVTAHDAAESRPTDTETRAAELLAVLTDVLTSVRVPVHGLAHRLYAGDDGKMPLWGEDDAGMHAVRDALLGSGLLVAPEQPEATTTVEGTRSRLPYWVQQRSGYGGSVFLHGVMLGFTRGEWPVQAFTADEHGGCSMGARWVADRPNDRLLVGPVPIPDDVPVLKTNRMPERIDLTPVADDGEGVGGEQCDESCHDANLDTCPKCDTGTWSLMCDSCRSYAAQDSRRADR